MSMWGKMRFEDAGRALAEEARQGESVSAYSGSPINARHASLNSCMTEPPQLHGK